MQRSSSWRSGAARAHRRSLWTDARLPLALAALALLGASEACRSAREPVSRAPARWWKGNTHTHTLWSDGNGAPEAVAQWYRERGYQFLVLSDHDLLLRGERWFEVSDKPGARLTPAKLDALRAQFGDEAVEVRASGEKLEMRLKTLAELRERFEQAGRFLLIEGEEVSARFEQVPVHVNALNLAEPIPPQPGGSVRDVLQKNLAAIREQGQRLGRPVLAHVNHPNFRWALTWEDLAFLQGEQFYEVYNGHPETFSAGDAMHLGTEAAWDRALTRRLTSGDGSLLYGIASDDSHDYDAWGAGKVNPGRGWVVVRAQSLTPGTIVAAMLRGDFYASTGVVLDELSWDGRRYRVSVAAREGETCTIRFVGTRGKPGTSYELAGEVGEVLAETSASPAVYAWRGDELYVRAVVTSSRLQDNPVVPGDPEKAWTQPVRAMP